MTTSTGHAMAGSQPFHGTDVVKLGKALPEGGIDLSLYLRRPGWAELASRYEAKQRAPGVTTPSLSHAELLERHSADEQDIAQVTAFAQAHGLTVVAVDRVRCVVKLRASAEALASAFGVELALFTKGEQSFRSHEGAVYLPAALEGIVTAVVGLDNHPIARRGAAPQATAKAASPQPGSIAQYTSPQVAQLYNFPQSFAGSDQCLGIIELGAGYFESDLDAYFSALEIPKPEIISVGPNQPGTQSKPSHGYGEVVMDIEVAGAVVPKAKIVVYFATENSQQGFIEVIEQAIFDTTNAPQVLSVSWGESEVAWSQGAAEQMRQVIYIGALLGVTVCVAAGDDGASDGLPDGKLSVDFPCSVPEALACGGTRLVGKGSTIDSEVTWNDPQWALATGGGVSIHFALPAYQADAQVPPLPPAGAWGGRSAGFAGRGVPDVAGNADPLTGYRLYILGAWYIDAGTSAVAPLWAALAIQLGEALGRRLGSINGALYAQGGSQCFRDITQGDNGYYHAQPGWDACTGWGSPNGEALLAALRRTFAG